MTINAVTACRRFSSDNGAVLGSRTTTRGVRRFAPDTPKQRPPRRIGNEDVPPAEASNPAEGTQSRHASLYVAEQRASGTVACTDLAPLCVKPRIGVRP